MRVALIILFFANCYTSIAQSTLPVSSHIKEVTVFLSRAQVVREGRVSLPAGKSQLVIGNLPAELDDQSIQVTGKGRFTLLGTTHQQNFLTEFSLPKNMRTWKDSTELLQRQITLEQGQSEILNKEEQLLLSNQKIGGVNQNLTVAELKAMADFYRSRLTDIASARLKSQERITVLTELKNKVQRQLDAQRDLLQRNTSEIVISVSAEAPTAAELEISYVVNNAGWTPTYDISATNLKSPLRLSYKANVFQSTGEDWTNVMLTLSTTNPTLGGLKPELATWYLNFFEPIAYKLQGKVAGLSIESAKERKLDSTKGFFYNAPTPASVAADFTSTVQTSVNTAFVIAIPYTVPSAGKPTTVDIRNDEVPATYIYSSAPKLDNDAFLLAQATGWEELSLLPGEANIFFEGTFTGKSFIDPANLGDTLSLSLGRDKRIVVKREKKKELTTRRLIGANQRETFAWEISVRNTKAEAIQITLEDQVPVSQNSQIEVNVADTGGARYDKDSGKLVWDLSLAPNETKKVTFRYEVKYPKGRRVNDL